MPLYEYRCRACGRTVEKIQSVNAEPLKVCEACGGELERLISPSAIQFKGSGWYVTDYSRKGAPPPASRTETGAEKTSAGSEKNSKTDAAGAKPAESKSANPPTTDR